MLGSHIHPDFVAHLPPCYIEGKSKEFGFRKSVLVLVMLVGGILAAVLVKYGTERG